MNRCFLTFRFIQIYLKGKNNRIFQQTARFHSTLKVFAYVGKRIKGLTLKWFRNLHTLTNEAWQKHLESIKRIQ